MFTTSKVYYRESNKLINIVQALRCLHNLDSKKLGNKINIFEK